MFQYWLPVQKTFWFVQVPKNVSDQVQVPKIVSGRVQVLKNSFCPNASWKNTGLATIIEVNEVENKIKVHYDAFPESSDEYSSEITFLQKPA